MQLANKILEMCVNLVVRYVEYAEKWPSFAEILVAVFSSDEYYYKTNNQFIDYRVFLQGSRVSRIVWRGRPTGIGSSS